MLAMREMDLVDYLATEHGRREARLQMITFGPDYREAVDALSDEALLSLALAFARREHVVLAPSARSGAFNEMLAKRLSFRPKPLARLNRTLTAFELKLLKRPDIRCISGHVI
jgi:hypothetical protein